MEIMEYIGDTPSTRRFKMPRAIMALMLREMATTYGRTPGGYIWAFLEPLGTIIVLSIVFALVLRSPSIGNNFPLFYSAAFLPFTLYKTTEGKVHRALSYSGSLLTYPGVTFLDAILARVALNFLTTVIVMIAIISGITWYFDIRLIIDFKSLALGVGLASMMGMGVGTLNCYLLPTFPFYEKIWSMTTSPLMLLSCVLYIYEDVPSGFAPILWLNPLAHITGISRKGIFATYEATYASPIYVFFFAMITFTIGLMLLVRHHRDIINM